MFRVDYTVPNTGREYGAIYLNQENIAHTLVREGWADVREVRASDAENVDVEALYSYKAEAQAAKRGIWAEDNSVRSIFFVVCIEHTIILLCPNVTDFLIFPRWPDSFLLVLL